MAFCRLKTVSLAFAVVANACLLRVQAGYVELFKDADFQTKIATVSDVKPMYCYNIVCDRLNDVVASARWGGLPEEGKMFGHAGAKIEFFAAWDCDEAADKYGLWPVKTQSNDSLHFPSNFRLDDLDDAISSFMVLTAGHSKLRIDACAESATLAATNETLDGVNGEGSVAVGNETVGLL